MDGDGDPDVVTAASKSDQFAWYESPIILGGGGGGSCLIARSGLSDSALETLRGLRDGLLDSPAGRHLTSLYYHGFGGLDA